MRNRQKGTSLFDVLISVSIVMVLSAISLPRTNQTVNLYRLRSDAHQIAAQCQNARMIAIAANTSCRLHWNATALEVQRLSGSIYTRVDGFQLSRGVELSSAWAADPIFSPRGTTSGAVTITLQNAQGQSRTITVSMLGLVHEQ